MRHVLIIDDALSLGRLLKTALSSLDSTMPVVVVSSAEDAILEGTRYPLDLLITDIQIQEILRVDLIGRIRSRHPDLRVIVIGSIFDDERSKQVKALDADAYFNKPLNIPEFTAAARRFLGLGDVGEFQAEIGEDSQTRSTPTPQLVDVLTDFRRRSGALAVVLLDENGKILIQAGYLEEETYQRWIPEIMSAANVSYHLSRTLGKVVPENVMYFTGDNYHLVLTPVFTLVLLTVLEKNTLRRQQAFIFEETLKITKTLGSIFRDLGMESYPSAVSITELEESPAAEEIVTSAKNQVTTEDLSSLFAREGENKGTRQADSFWESLPGESPFESNEPDTLSFDQAQRLGFTPEESEEE